MTTRQAPRARAVYDDLATLLPDWQISPARPRTAARHDRSLPELSPGTSTRTWSPTACRPRSRRSPASTSSTSWPTCSSGSAPATVAKHYRSLQQLFRWLVDDGEITGQPMERMSPADGARAAGADPRPTTSWSRCSPPARATRFENRRDDRDHPDVHRHRHAAVELVGLTVEDVDLEQQIALVMGKGGRGRAVPVRRQDRRRAAPLPARPGARTRWPRHHRRSGSGRKGPLTDSGVRADARAPRRRRRHRPIHPHRFRHTMAHRWLAAGGQETRPDAAGRLATREMVGRYAASAADGRARDAHRRMALGDQL